MAILNPGDFPIDPTVVDGTELAARLNRLKLAMFTGYSSSSRPTDIKAGGLWVQENPPGTFTLKLYDGTTDTDAGGGAALASGTTPPTGAKTGDFFYNTSTGAVSVYNGSAWVPLGSTTTSGTAAPASPKLGDIFLNTTTNAASIYDGAAWQPLGSTPTFGGTRPATPQAGDTYLDTATGVYEVYDGTKWVAVGGVGKTQVIASPAANLVLDFSAYENFVITLDKNITLADPTTELLGMQGFIVFIQDGTGSRTVANSTQYKTPGGTGILPSAAASAVSIVPYAVQAADNVLIGAAQVDFA